MFKHAWAIGLLGCYSLGAEPASETLLIDLKTPAYFAEQALPPTHQTAIQADAGTLTITLNNGCAIRRKPDGELTITTANGVVLYWLPAGQAPFGLKYIPAGMGRNVVPKTANLTFELLEISRFGEAVTLHFSLKGDDGTSSLLSWRFLPVRQQLNGKLFVGVADNFEILDSAHFLHELSFNGLLVSGSDGEGARSFRLAPYSQPHGYAELKFAGKPVNSGTWGSTIDGGQSFHLLGIRRGSIVDYLDDEAHDMTLMERNNVYGLPDIRHTLTLGRVTGIYASPRRFRLFTSEPLSPQLWMEITQSRKKYFQNKYSIEPTIPRPAVFYRNFWYTQSFKDVQNDILPQFAQAGFKRCEIGWIYERGIDPNASDPWCGEHVFRPDGSYNTWRPRQTEMKDTVMNGFGGGPAIRALTDRAHALGLEVYVWHQTAHGWQGDPILRHYPEWMVHAMNGGLVSGDYAGSLAWFDLSSGFLPFTLARIKRMKEELNIDGLWLDMYGSGVFNSVNYAKLIAAPTVAERLQFIRALRQMGLGVYTEGVSTTGLDSFEMQGNGNWKGHEFILYGTCPFDWQIMPDPVNGLDYFKLLSFQCFPTDVPFFLASNPKRDPARVAEMVYRNTVFNRIDLELGPTPTGILIHPLGTQWVMPQGNVLFFSDPGNIRLKLPSAGSRLVTLSPAGEFPVTVSGTDLTAAVPKRGIILIMPPIPHNFKDKGR